MTASISFFGYNKMKAIVSGSDESIMRSYQIYLIEDEFADYFYGKEKMFYHLFSEYEYAPDGLRDIIRKQVLYVTKPLPSLYIHQILFQNLRKNKDFHCKGNTYFLESASCSNGVKLTLKGEYLELIAWGNFDAESIFFKALRHVEGKLLAVDLEHGRYGWLKPKKIRNYV
ncbi:sporulation inhibitor of replication protein SirA [Bacillus chungangensis]|uniref:Sporulation inhibitor of replication protein SirA n=1 Tax=Bacillus chungangensis TaxID=587633 RepID=A0ABT9X0A4_9BACI|nr:sporulation inhibitor of replication protein SirA [Bacillus chungangensis]MDQ0178517.1 hypothetical protein [Bacillus chungangensis]